MSVANHIELSSAAKRDLNRLSTTAHRQIVKALTERLAAVPPPENLDVKSLEGAPGWLRLRVGTYRVLYRAMTEEELGTARARHGELPGPEGFLVARVVHRRDLHAAARSL
ncbi:MAG TPA: type II toxin-antitoxin system RelE/ParE family toxin [Acidimicrobiales bacterium]|nr:type II toxin-antitoxin system RelE/ParE family toxin [Acidimicrobiales bacterium]